MALNLTDTWQMAKINFNWQLTFVPPPPSRPSKKGETDRSKTLQVFSVFLNWSELNVLNICP